MKRWLSKLFDLLHASERMHAATVASRYRTVSLKNPFITGILVKVRLHAGPNIFREYSTEYEGGYTWNMFQEYSTEYEYPICSKIFSQLFVVEHFTT